MMQSILEWAKGNILNLVLIALVIILPPAGYVGATFWNSSIKKNVETTYQDEKRDLERSARVSYVIPPIDPGEAAWEESGPPNQAMVDFVVAEREERQAQIERVIERAVAENKPESREVLVRGLFPAAEDERAERELARELVDILDVGGDRPSAYEALFRSINAGTPPDPVTVARRVNDLWLAQQEQFADAQGGTRMTDAQLEELGKAMIGLRVDMYRGAASAISVYGSVDVLTPAAWEPAAGTSTRRAPTTTPDTNPVPASYVPVRGPRSDAPPSGAEAFVFQWDYWFLEDLFTAIATVNTDDNGLLTDVPRSVVKRIESIRLDVPTLSQGEQADAGGSPWGSGGGRDSRDFDDRDRDSAFGTGASGFGGPLAGGAAPQEAVELVHKGVQPVRHTKRSSSAANQTYDVRRATLRLVVSSAGLERLLDAIRAVNFMTVIGLRTEAVDRLADLEAGYFYGPEHVVRAEIEVESVWLRFWMRDAMPEALRAELGVVMPEPVVEDMDAESFEQEG